MSISRACNGCGETIPAVEAGAITVQRDANPGVLHTPGLAALDRTDWCKRCAAPILAAVAESLTRARQARERRAMQQQATSIKLPRDLKKNRHLRLTSS